MGEPVGWWRGWRGVTPVVGWDRRVERAPPGHLQRGVRVAHQFAGVGEELACVRLVGVPIQGVLARPDLVADVPGVVGRVDPDLEAQDPGIDAVGRVDQPVDRRLERLLTPRPCAHLDDQLHRVRREVVARHDLTTSRTAI